MKITSKLVTTSLGLIFIGSSVFAQSLPDAKKAIDAEQYQKAKSILKNLTVTQPTKDENYFYLGWVYIKQDYPDSAKMMFNKGIAADPKSAINYAGLGALDLLDNPTATTSPNFDKAMSLTDKRDVTPYVYIARAYLLGKKPILVSRAEAAVAILEKVKTDHAKVALKDPDLFVTLGDANSAKGDANHAYLSYADAQALDPNSPNILVKMAVLIKGAGNFEDAIKGFQGAITADPNFGPAYREMAETDLLIANADPRQAMAKDKEAVEYYKKYLDLTDRSNESRFRYEDFLVYAKDWKTLEQEATDLAKVDSKDLRVYRYLGYAAYENGNYPAALSALNTWLKDAAPKRIIPDDYVYLGRIQIKTGKDSIGILNLKKALALDTTETELYVEMAHAYYSNRKYLDAADSYKTYIEKSRRHTLNDYLGMGRSYFYAFENQQDAYATSKVAPDTSLLVKADSALSYVNHHVPKPYASITLIRARIADSKEPTDRAQYKGYAKDMYEQYITEAGTATDAGTKKGLLEAYIYLGFHYELSVKDDAKAAEYWAKAKEIDPSNKQVQAYYTRHPAGGPAKGK